MQMLILGKCLPPQTAFGLAFQLGHFQLKNEGEKRRDLSSSSLSPFHLEMHLLKKAKRLKLQCFPTVHAIQTISLKRQAQMISQYSAYLANAHFSCAWKASYKSQEGKRASLT